MKLAQKLSQGLSSDSKYLENNQMTLQTLYPFFKLRSIATKFLGNELHFQGTRKEWAKFLQQYNYDNNHY